MKKVREGEICIGKKREGRKERRRAGEEERRREGGRKREGVLVGIKLQLQTSS